MSRSYHKSAEIIINGRFVMLENVLTKQREYRYNYQMDKKKVKRALSHSVKLPYYTEWEKKAMRKKVRRLNKNMMVEEYQFQKYTIV